MPFFILVIAIVFLVAAMRNKQDDLLSLIKSDFTGNNNFILWVMAIAFIVLLGNIKEIKPISNAFLILVILVMIIANYKNGGNIFAKFVNQVKSGTQNNSNSLTDMINSVTKAVSKF